jgi:DNA-binding transcriptional regulator YiaG
MAKRKHSALGRRLIASAKEMAAHAKGELKLEEEDVRVPPPVNVSAIRKNLGSRQSELARCFGFYRRSVRD